VPHDRGLQGHSDADVGMHAVTDAIYGAMAEGDIGRHFPPSDPQWKGAESHSFLRHAVDLALTKGFFINNIDVTLVCERPKVGPHARAMQSLSGQSATPVLEIDDRVVAGSTAILLALDELAPDRPLFPAEPEARTRKHSMSHANVLEPRLRTDGGARRMLVRLVTRLGGRLRREGYLASELGIEVRYADGRRLAASGTLPQVQDTPTLLACLYGLWEGRGDRRGTPRQVGAVVGGLVLASQTPAMLFGRERANAGLSRAMDLAVGRWGPQSLYFGSMHGCSHHMDEKIAFGRVPQG